MSLHSVCISYATVLSVGEKRPEKEIRLCWESTLAFQSWLKCSFLCTSLSKGDSVVFNNWGKLNAVDLNGLTYSFSLIVNYLQKLSSAVRWIPVPAFIQWNKIFELVFPCSSADYDELSTSELCLKQHVVKCTRWMLGTCKGKGNASFFFFFGSIWHNLTSFNTILKLWFTSFSTTILKV